MAELTVQLFVAATNWLAENGCISRHPSPPGRWRTQLRKDWAESTKIKPEAYRPRFTSKEAKKIFDSQKAADPRVRLAVQIGAEYRMGQVVRVRRSDVRCDADGRPNSVNIPGKERKEGALVVLTPPQSLELQTALSPQGHLGRMEALFQAGELENYPLFPAGTLTNGHVNWDGKTSMNRRTLLGQFYDWEAHAQVPHRKGRGFYGLRRIFSDLTRTETQDERVRDAGGGWKPGSGTRSQIYMDQHDVEVFKEAAEVRGRVRNFDTGESTGDPKKGTTPSQRSELEMALDAEGLSEGQVAAMMELLRGMKS